ncbi:hypothetical protein ATI61_105206 [Archangium gephyra]|uniref:TPR repeat-containing protein n=1 Tax=Archangium gephyra TaxID=48 RepID=A0AAC8TI17_9BACT|nr:hypothetical protein [Archangium gephyra]AKJ06827.1 TPR repeat-containing protein [Archangium gephyra]REG31879.1 hypothetical protein ATI61_105206 [Archangium gephyra]
MDDSSSKRWFDSPRALWACLAVALVMGLSTLGIGFALDDNLHLLMFEGRWPLGSPMDLFRFAGGDAEGMRRIVQEGPYPWWTLPELKIAFWRPLASALETLDYRLFGRNAVGYHVHSVLWYLGVVALFGALLRRLIPGSLAVLALLLFAVDDAHLMPVGWISNRNALVSTALALVGLWMHLEWREAGKRWALPVSLLVLAVSLTAGESALGVFAYVLAYELSGARGTVAERLRAVAPAAVLAVAYLGVYKALGYGAYGSAMYLDPVAEPGRYLEAALGRVPALIGGLLGVPVDLWGILLASRPALVGLGLAGLAVFVVLVRSAWPGLSEEERRHGRWLSVGALLSLLPVTSSMPMGRLLFVPSLGASVLLAVVLRHAWRSRARGWRPRGVAVAGAVLALFHLVLAPLSWPVLSMAIRQLGTGSVELAQKVRGELDPARIASQRVVVLEARDIGVLLYLPVHWALQGQALPRSWWPLAMVQESPIVTRTGPNSLALELPQGGHFLATEAEQTLRSPEHMLKQGEQVKLEGMQVTVLAADAQGPTRLGFEFDVPLEDPSLVFLHWREGTLRRLTPPPEGTRVDLSAVAGGPEARPL